MDAASKKTMLELIGKLLDDPTSQVDMYAGMKDTTKPGDTTASYAPDGSKTVVIRIKGGANNVEITAVKTDNNEEDPWGRDGRS